VTDGQYAIPRFYAVRRAVKTVFLIRCFRNVRLSQSSLTALACSDCCLSNCTATLRGFATIEFVMVGGKQTNDGGVTQLRRLRQIRNCVSRDVMAQLVMSLVISRLDYCNSMFSGLPASSLAPLQRVQNAAARLVHNLDQQSHITSALQQLHWLPDKFRIVFNAGAPNPPQPLSVVSHRPARPGRVQHGGLTTISAHVANQSRRRETDEDPLRQTRLLCLRTSYMELSSTSGPQH